MGIYSRERFRTTRGCIVGFADRLKKAASNAAYTVGYGVGKASKALQDAAEDPRTKNALANARSAVNRAADATEAFADRMSPKLREFADKAAPVLQDVADRAVSAAKDAAQKAAPAVREAAEGAGAKASDAARRAGEAAKKAGTAAAGSVRTAATKAAVKNAAGMREADARPHTVTDPQTGQRVVVEAYVKTPGGGRDYDAVYPKGAMRDFGPLGNKAVGMLLVMAGVPMLVLPGPGAAAIAAGLYFLRKGGDAGAADGAGDPAGGAASGRRSSDDVVPATGVVVSDAPDADAPSEGSGDPTR